MIEACFAPLTPALIRRGSPPIENAVIRIGLSPPLMDDIRLFVFAWAAGFAFFLTFVA